MFWPARVLDIAGCRGCGGNPSVSLRSTAPLKGEPLMWVLLCLSVEQWRKPEETGDRKGRPYAGVSGSDRVQHGPGDPAPTHFFRWFVGAGFPRPSAEVSSSVRVGSRKIRERQKIPPVR